MCNKIWHFISCCGLLLLFLSISLSVVHFSFVRLISPSAVIIWLRTVLEPVWVTKSVIWNRRATHHQRTIENNISLLCSVCFDSIGNPYAVETVFSIHNDYFGVPYRLYFFIFYSSTSFLYIYFTDTHSFSLSLCYPRSITLSVYVEVCLVRAIKSNPSNLNQLTGWYKHSKLSIIAHIYNIIYPQHIEAIYTRIKLQPIEFVYFIWLLSIWVLLVYAFLSSILFYRFPALDCVCWTCERISVESQCDQLKVILCLT